MSARLRRARRAALEGVGGGVVPPVVVDGARDVEDGGYRKVEDGGIRISPPAPSGNGHSGFLLLMN